MKTYIVVDDSLVEVTDETNEKAQKLYLIIQALTTSENKRIIYNNKIFDLDSSGLFCSKKKLSDYAKVSTNELNHYLRCLVNDLKIEIVFQDEKFILIKLLIPY